MLKKRIRASNFNGEEEDILIKCILQYASIIENKKTDAGTLREKQQAWEEIGNEFNSLCPNVPRQIKALKDKYTNLKTMLRKQSAAEKANCKAIADGKDIPDWRRKNEALAELAKLISTSISGTSPRTFEGDDYDYESHDAVVPSVESLNVESDVDEKPIDLLNLEPVEVQPINNYDSLKNATVDNNSSPKISQPSTMKSWSKYTHSILRRQNQFKHKRQQSASAASSSRSIVKNTLQSMKQKLTERTLEMREIEHRTRLRQQQREHEARLALLDAQKIDFETKVKLRELKIAKLTKQQIIKKEVDSE